MPQLHLPVTSFQSGEINPLLYGRTQTDFYRNSCRYLENMFVHVEGPVQKRGGTRFISSAHKEDSEIRLIPFDFSADQSYVLEFGDKYVRILTRDGVLLDENNVLKNGWFNDGTDEWTSGSGVTFTVTDGVASLSTGYIDQTIEDTVLIDQKYELTATTSGEPFTLDVFGLYTPDGGSEQTDTLFSDLSVGDSFTVTDAKYTKIKFRFKNTSANVSTIEKINVLPVNRDYIVESPYTSEQIQNVQTVQSADVVFMVHPDIKPKEFSRSLDEYGKIKWSFADYEYDDGPYDTVNTDDGHKLKASATTGNATVTATGFKPFTEKMIGGFLRLKDGNKWGYGEITAVASSTSCTVKVVSDFGGTTDTAVWQLPAWTDDTGWPSTITIFEQRVFFGRTNSKPQGFWGTVSGDFYKFTPTENDGQVKDDNALILELGGPRVSLISWITGAQNLVFGTGGGLYRTNTTNSAPLSAETARVLYDNGTQCSSLQPVQIGTIMLFLQRQRKKIFSVQYDFAADALVDDNIAQFSEHLINSPVKDMVLQREPNNLLWVILDDGSLRSCTYVPTQSVVAWHRHKIGGSFRGGPSRVESVASISGYNEDNLWMVVRRTIDGDERRYIERIVEDDEPEQEFSFYVDSGRMVDVPVTISDVQPQGSDKLLITTADVHGLVTGDKVKFYDIVVDANEDGTAGKSLNGERLSVTVVDTKNFTVPAISAEYSSYISGGTARKYFSTITGLDHLEGQTVSVLADGAVRPAETVTGGTLTLSQSAAVVVVGLGYSAILSPVQYETPLPDSRTAMDRKVRNYETNLIVYRSLGLKFGTRLDKLDIKPFRTTSDRMDTAIPLYSGKVEIKPASNYRKEEPLYLVNDQPLPFTVTAMIYKLSVR